MNPFKSEHEGYQGNYGNTVDRWYHRAAFVMWPRENTFALRAQASPQWAVDELLAWPGANTAELQLKVSSVLPRWNAASSGTKDARFVAKVLKVSARIDDGAIALAWLLPLGLHRLTSKAIRSGLAALIDKHGLVWGQELFSEWTTRQRWGTPPWAALLADICADLHATDSKASRALASWLLEGQVKSALERSSAALGERVPWLDLEFFGDEAKHLAHTLAAAAAISAHNIITQTLSELLRAQPTPSPALIIQLLDACSARSPALKTCIAGSSLHRACAERLGKALLDPARVEGDWSITYPLSCACADCKELSEFIHSGRAERDWPLNKFRRQHIHQMIDSSGLPIVHTTLRSGSPQVLQLRKDRSLFSREQSYRARVKKVLDALPAAQRDL